MPKRRNPFGDCAPIQFKTHVGVKEIDTGVRQDELMKNVYEKTRQMLFSGAHKDIDVNENHVSDSFTPPQNQTSVCLEPTQARLNSKGQLIMPVNEACCQVSGKQTLPDVVLPSLTNYRNAAAGLAEAAPLPLIPGQMCLDSHGQLSAPMDCECDAAANSGVGETSSPDNKPVNQPQGLENFGFKFSKQESSKTQNVAICHACRRPLAVTGYVRCYFCEKGVCPDCMRQCDLCNHNFCQVCTTLNYDEAMEKAFCLTCIS